MICAGLLLWFLSPAARAFTVPKGLDDGGRRTVTRTLGLNSATKLLSNPYPLGGFAGWEVGYSLEVIDVRDLRDVGTSGQSDETSWRYSRLTLGKGLYNDVDVFLSVVPPTGQVLASDFGGSLRWAIYQATFLPVNLSLLVEADQLNFANQFSNLNVGAELLIGVNVDDVAIYFGGGLWRANGTFQGPDQNGVCSDDCTVEDASAVNQITRAISTTVQTTRTLIGISYQWENLFAAAEIDRVQTAVYSMKLGARF